MRVGNRQPMRAATLASARGSFGCLHGGLELVGRKSWHAVDATHSLRCIPHREAQQRFGIWRIDDIDEIVVSLGVVDRLYLDAKLFELATRLVGTLGLLERPFGTERPEQPHSRVSISLCSSTLIARGANPPAWLKRELKHTRSQGQDVGRACSASIRRRDRTSAHFQRVRSI